MEQQLFDKDKILTLIWLMKPICILTMRKLN